MTDGRWHSVGTVIAGRTDPNETDHWGNVISVIEIAPWLGDQTLVGLQDFSHVEVLFALHLAEERPDYHPRPSRGRTDLPAVGVFADRGPRRPNRLAVTQCRILATTDNHLLLRGLDAVAGTPVVDIKPVVHAFQPASTTEPSWVHEVLKDYWQ
jgi:tRNA (adenine37-N6)-methyltransferase